MAALVLTGCGKGEGEGCNPAANEDCSSEFDTESMSCLSCGSGYTSSQGVCTTELTASPSACAEAYPSPVAGSSCSNAWTCNYDGQATPMCLAACNYTGSQRTQTCQVLASMVTSGNAGECCTVCR
jgi:hypothetical protein